MSKTAVIYASHYGATKCYAQWLATALNADLLERKATKKEMLAAYDTIIYGGGLYAGGVNGIDLLVKNWPAIQTKRVAIFTCGLADVTDTENTQHIKQSLNKVLIGGMYDQVTLFHLRGDMNYKKLNWLHRTMMGMMYRMLKKKAPDTLRQEDKEMIATYGQVVDFKEKAAIEPIVQWAHSTTCN